MKGYKFETNEGNVVMGIALIVTQKIKQLNKIQEKNKTDIETYIRKRQKLQNIIKDFKNQIERIEVDEYTKRLS